MGTTLWWLGLTLAAASTTVLAWEYAYGRKTPTRLNDLADQTKARVRALAAEAGKQIQAGRAWDPTPSTTLRTAPPGHAIAAGIGLLAGIALLIVAATTSTATADAATHQRTLRTTNTHLDLIVRSQPYKSADITDRLGPGSSVTAICVQQGDTVTGTNGITDVWAHITSPTDGWVTAAYLTPTASDLPNC